MSVGIRQLFNPDGEGAAREIKQLSSLIDELTESLETEGNGGQCGLQA